MTPAFFSNGGVGGHCHCHIYTPCHSKMGTLQRSGAGSRMTECGGGPFSQHKCSICDFGQVEQLLANETDLQYSQ